MQIPTTTAYHVSPWSCENGYYRRRKIRMLGRMQRMGTPVHCWWGCKLVELFWAQYEGSSENETRIILRFSNCPFVYTWKRIEVSMLQKYLHFHFLFTAVLLTAVKNGSNLSVQHLLYGKEKCTPSIFIHTYSHACTHRHQEFYSAIKWNCH